LYPTSAQPGPLGQLVLCQPGSKPVCPKQNSE
jgi:hypothetical protein